MEMIGILKKYEDSLPPSVIHCFTGVVEQAKAYLDMGLYLGVTGKLPMKHATMRCVPRPLLNILFPIPKI